jgi:hypothetical protein
VGISFNIASTLNLTNLRWSSDGYNNINGYGNSYGMSIQASQYGYSNTYKSATLFADAPCGPVSYSFGFNVMSLGWRMAVAASPSPSSSGEINVMITKEYDNAVRPANFPADPVVANPYTKITLTPTNNNSPTKTYIYKEDVNTSYKINTLGLSKGTYAITVDRDNVISTIQVVVL